MKVDRNNPRHWIILFTSAILLIFALPWRLIPNRKKKIVILYGHKLNGNLLPFYELNDKKLEFFYMSLDREYLESLHGRPRILNGIKYKDLIMLARADVMITDHGLHHFAMLKKLTACRFIDVWHGIPYKGFGLKNFPSIRDYDQVWVSSESMKKMYVEKFGFDEKIVQPVGYARVERLMNLDNTTSQEMIRKKYGLEKKKTILIAPTWKQDDNGRSIIPFGLELREFIDTIAGADRDLQVIFRAHLNVKDMKEIEDVAPNIKIMPYAQYPVGEDFLAITDVLISDWSSIVFDFMPLNRPVIYLGVPAPFKQGFSLGPEYRFGEVVSDKNQLANAVRYAATDPRSYQKQYDEVINKTYQVAYGNTLDGSVIRRSLENIYNLLGIS